jgi:hypothetical protein
VVFQEFDDYSCMWAMGALPHVLYWEGVVVIRGVANHNDLEVRYQGRDKEPTLSYVRWHPSHCFWCATISNLVVWASACLLGHVIPLWD